MRPWQKGIIYGFILTTILSIFYSVVLIIFEILLARQGLPHMCFAFTESYMCTFEEAIYTRLGFIVVLIFIFGIPAAFFGGLIGYLIERLKISR